MEESSAAARSMLVRQVAEQEGKEAVLVRELELSAGKTGVEVGWVKEASLAVMKGGERRATAEEGAMGGEVVAAMQVRDLWEEVSREEVKKEAGKGQANVGAMEVEKMAVRLE